MHQQEHLVTKVAFQLLCNHHTNGKATCQHVDSESN